jgi:hypothetical protein
MAQRDKSTSAAEVDSTTLPEMRRVMLPDFRRQGNIACGALSNPQAICDQLSEPLSDYAHIKLTGKFAALLAHIHS